VAGLVTLHRRLRLSLHANAPLGTVRMSGGPIRGVGTQRDSMDNVNYPLGLKDAFFAADENTEKAAAGCGKRPV